MHYANNDVKPCLKQQAHKTLLHRSGFRSYADEGASSPEMNGLDGNGYLLDRQWAEVICWNNVRRRLIH